MVAGSLSLSVQKSRNNAVLASLGRELEAAMIMPSSSEIFCLKVSNVKSLSGASWKNCPTIGFVQYLLLHEYCLKA